MCYLFSLSLLMPIKSFSCHWHWGDSRSFNKYTVTLYSVMKFRCTALNKTDTIYVLAGLTTFLSTPTRKQFRCLRIILSWGAQVAQSIRHPTLDFSSGHDPGVVGLSRTSGSMLSAESACQSFSAPPLLMLSTHLK